MSFPFETFLQVRSATGGAFSPDGRTLAFLMNTTGSAQVYRLDEPGAEPVPLTRFEDTVRSVHWSPDGSRLLFAMDEGGSERAQLFLMTPEGKDLRPLTRAPAAIHTFGGWAHDGRRIAFAANRRNAAFFDVYTLDLDSGAEECVLQRDAYMIPAAWSPDGRRLLVVEHHTSSNQDLYELEVATGDLRRLAPHAGNARYISPRYFPDGRRVLVSTDQGRDFLQLSLLDLETGALTVLLDEPGDIEACDVSRDGECVAALRNRDGWSEVIAGAVRAGALEISARRDLRAVATACQLCPSGARIAVSSSGPAANPNVWELAAPDLEPVQWTRASWGALDPGILVEPEPVRYPTHDGLAIPALLYRAQGAGERLPVVVHVHGGPESQDRPGFSAVFQYLVHRGYAVLAPNVRGSIGYGNAYSHMDDREKRYDALRDVEYTYRWLAETGVGDPARIAIMGASYGGFTVLACLTRQPDLWAAGVDIVGISNFETFFKHTGPWRRPLRASEYGDPETDLELLRDLSPIHAVDRIRAPLMVIQGANDPRVPQEQSDQMVEQLRARNQPVEYLLFPDEGHGVVKIPNRVTAYTAIARFLDRYPSGVKSRDFKL